MCQVEGVMRRKNLFPQLSRVKVKESLNIDFVSLHLIIFLSNVDHLLFLERMFTLSLEAVQLVA